MTIGKLIKSRDKWKQKAKKSSREANLLRKQNKRLHASRACWKQKYHQRLKSEVSAGVSNGADKIKGHSYGSAIISLCLCLKLCAQQSVGSISKSISIWAMIFELEMKAPCHSTVHSWLRKAGYFRLCQCNGTSPQGQWVIFIDESVCMGREKLLLILATDISEVNQQKLSFSNCRCLYLASSTSWPADSIAKAIEGLKQKLCGPLRFAVIDKGNNIKKAMRLSGICYIHDLTHEIAHRLSEQYKEAPDFKAYCQWAALLRRQQVLSSYAHLMPPQQKSKARFHNIEPLCRWGKSIKKELEKWRGQAPELYEKYKKISEFKELLEELDEVLAVISKLKEICATGIKRSLLVDIIRLLDTLEKPRAALFAKKIKQYFIDSFQSLNWQNIPICCSDIIESAFSKYKQMMPSSQFCGITDLALAIPAFMGESWNNNKVKEALQKVRCKDYKEWSSKNMEPSLLSKRRKELPNTGT
jgi:hypothetical protein